MSKQPSFKTKAEALAYLAQEQERLAGSPQLSTDQLLKEWAQVRAHLRGEHSKHEFELHCIMAAILAMNRTDEAIVFADEARLLISAVLEVRSRE